MPKKTTKAELAEQGIAITPVEELVLNLDFGRQDLNDNFRLIQDAINELRKK